MRKNRKEGDVESDKVSIRFMGERAVEMLRDVESDVESDIESDVESDKVAIRFMGERAVEMLRYVERC